MLRIKHIHFALFLMLTIHLPYVSANSLCSCGNEITQSCTANLVSLVDHVEIFTETTQCTRVSWQTNQGEHTELFNGGYKLIYNPKVLGDDSVKVNSCIVCTNTSTDTTNVSLSDVAGQWAYRDINLKDPNYQYQGKITFTLSDNVLIGQMKYDTKGFEDNDVRLEAGSTSGLSGMIHNVATTCMLKADKKSLHCAWYDPENKPHRKGIVIFER